MSRTRQLCLVIICLLAGSAKSSPNKQTRMQAYAHALDGLPLCGVVGAELCVVAVQAVLGGSQKVRTWGCWGKANVQRGSAHLQHQQLTGRTDRTEIFSKITA